MTTKRYRTCADCGQACTGERCRTCAPKHRIGKPRGVADPNRARPKEPSTRDLYPLPTPSDDTGPLTILEQGKALCTKILIKEKRDVCFPEDASSIEAKRLCHACPIQARCLAIGIAGNEPIGVWGGATLAEREQIRRGMVKANA